MTNIERFPSGRALLIRVKVNLGLLEEKGWKLGPLAYTIPTPVVESAKDFIENENFDANRRRDSLNPAFSGEIFRSSPFVDSRESQYRTYRFHKCLETGLPLFPSSSSSYSPELVLAVELLCHNKLGKRNFATAKTEYRDAIAILHLSDRATKPEEIRDQIDYWVSAVREPTNRKSSAQSIQRILELLDPSEEKPDSYLHPIIVPDSDRAQTVRSLGTDRENQGLMYPVLTEMSLHVNETRDLLHVRELSTLVTSTNHGDSSRVFDQDRIARAKKDIFELTKSWSASITSRAAVFCQGEGDEFKPSKHFVSGIYIDIMAGVLLEHLILSEMSSSIAELSYDLERSLGEDLDGTEEKALKARSFLGQAMSLRTDLYWIDHTLESIKHSGQRIHSQIATMLGDNFQLSNLRKSAKADLSALMELVEMRLHIERAISIETAAKGREKQQDKQDKFNLFIALIGLIFVPISVVLPLLDYFGFGPSGSAILILILVFVVAFALSFFGYNYYYQPRKQTGDETIPSLNESKGSPH